MNELTIEEMAMVLPCPECGGRLALFENCIGSRLFQAHFRCVDCGTPITPAEIKAKYEELEGENGNE